MQMFSQKDVRVSGKACTSFSQLVGVPSEEVSIDQKRKNKRIPQRDF